MTPAWIPQAPFCARGRPQTSREAHCGEPSRAASRSATGFLRRWSGISPRTTSIWIIGRLAADAKRRLTPLQLARLLRSAAAEKKAWDPVVIDVRDQTSVADYFVICVGETDRAMSGNHLGSLLYEL